MKDAANDFPLTAVILAAGRSRRMGERNKLLLAWKGGRALVQAVVETVLSVGFERVIVVVGFERDLVEEALAKYPVQVVVNEACEEGLSTSVRRGVLACGEETEGYLFALGDMPMVKGEALTALCKAFVEPADPRAITVPVAGGRRGNPVLFGVGHREALLALEGDRGARGLLADRANCIREVPVGDDAGLFADADTPQDYQRLIGDTDQGRAISRSPSAVEPEP